MAKGDDSRSRNNIQQQGELAQNNLTNLREDTLIPQNQEFWNNYLRQRQGNEADYGNIKNQFQSFADTGGYSPGDLANIRGRANSPLSAVYANANRDVDRQRSLQGGYSPGYGVLKERMARGLGQGLSDASRDTEAQIAQMVQQGKQFGSSGLLSAYGATPGNTALAQQGVNASTQDRLSGEQLQQGLSLGRMNAVNQASQLPGKFDSALGQVKGVLSLGQQAAGMVYPWLNSTPPLPSANITPPSMYQPGGQYPNSRALGTPIR